MITYNDIMLVIAIISLLICLGQLLVALFTFLDQKREKKHKK